MKNLKLKVFELGSSDELTRDQMKKVTGASALNCSRPGEGCVTFADCCDLSACLHMAAGHWVCDTI